MLRCRTLCQQWRPESKASDTRASWHCGLFREVDVPSESNFRYKAATVHVAVARGVAETMSSCRFLPRLPSELSAPLFAGGRGGTDLRTEALLEGAVVRGLPSQALLEQVVCTQYAESRNSEEEKWWSRAGQAAGAPFLAFTCWGPSFGCRFDNQVRLCLRPRPIRECPLWSMPYRPTFNRIVYDRAQHSQVSPLWQFRVPGRVRDGNAVRDIRSHPQPQVGSRRQLIAKWRSRTE